MENGSREGFGTRLGFLLVSAGCAIGIGNVWKFPYVTGQNGGGIFVVLYLIFLVLIGIPILTMELAVGRGGKSTCNVAIRRLEPSGTRWHILGYLCQVGCYLLMFYYTSVSGWMLAYVWKFASGEFDKVAIGQEGTVFSNLLADPVQLTLFMAIIVISGFGILIFGVQKGLERVTKVMMIALLVLIIVLAVNSLTLSGAKDGLKFYLLPNFENVKSGGYIQTVTSAMTQAFFTLSLGIGSMEIFGSYMSRDNTLASESVRICALDTFVAIVSGIIIFPACFTFGIKPEEGPSLIFITLPNIFANMHMGRIWGTLFFVFMTFASFSTITAVFENLVVTLMDNYGISRKKSIIINLVIVLLGSIPCVLGFNVLKDVVVIGGKDVLGIEDLIVSNILLPLGSLLFLLFCVHKRGWGFVNYLKEANTGKGVVLSKGLRLYLTFILPALVVFVLAIGFVPIS